jgi:geranylgeranylglycerol-phosphate geranylgeranyltransferase
MWHILGKKAMGILELFRFELSFAAGVCVIVGELLALGTTPSINQIILGFLSGFFISSSALILNDYFDIETDKINAPKRPLPSGVIKPQEAILLTILASLIGLGSALLVSHIALIVGIIFWLIGVLYNFKLKETGLLGNLMVSSSVAITFIFGGIIVNQPWNIIVWVFALIAFFIDLAEEIAADAMDIIGDKKRGSKSIAIILGKKTALRVSGFLFSIVIIISFIPLILGLSKINYLIMILIMDSTILFSTVKLLKNRSTKEGRFYIRLIYLGALFGLISFLTGQFLI